MNRRTLFTLWKERDRRYAITRKYEHRLTDAMVDMVRAWRLKEVEDLDTIEDREVALAILGTWRPPLSETY